MGRIARIARIAKHKLSRYLFASVQVVSGVMGLVFGYISALVVDMAFFIRQCASLPSILG
jgi:hypothetical protein